MRKHRFRLYMELITIIFLIIMGILIFVAELYILIFTPLDPFKFLYTFILTICMAILLMISIVCLYDTLDELLEKR